MRLFVTALAAGTLLAGSLVRAPQAHAHATYNTSGYTSGLSGSTNGADGLPAGLTAAWTNGPVAEYAGGLPVNWYAGMHSTTQVRTIQTGLAPNPPSGSLLQQVVSYNGMTDPDLPTDLVLGVGGLSWTDPGNGNQGWGHGLDYGLVHFSPINDLLAGGPLKFTITLTDDPIDGVAPQLAFAIYGGWDTNAGSSRHQTFTTNPAPVNNPLGSTGLTLIDYVVATAAGQTLSRTYTLDATYGGEYTVFVGALGGVAGQYQLTVTTAPDAGLSQCQGDLTAATTNLNQCQSDLTTATTDLSQCEADLAATTTDTDGDGVADGTDSCAATPAATPVDQLGCSQAQFCGGFDVSTRAGVRPCKKADWGNDEPIITKKNADCTYDRTAVLCVPAP
jgi:hypothetical protein